MERLIRVAPSVRKALLPEMVAAIDAVAQRTGRGGAAEGEAAPGPAAGSTGGRAFWQFWKR